MSSVLKYECRATGPQGNSKTPNCTSKDVCMYIYIYTYIKYPQNDPITFRSLFSCINISHRHFVKVFTCDNSDRQKRQSRFSNRILVEAISEALKCLESATSKGGRPWMESVKVEPVFPGVYKTRKRTPLTSHTPLNQGGWRFAPLIKGVEG